MYEIEIKSLLGEKEKADAFREHLLSEGAELTGTDKQLNHYFQGSVEHLLPNVNDIVTSQQELLQKILTDGSNHSVRTPTAVTK